VLPITIASHEFNSNPQKAVTTPIISNMGDKAETKTLTIHTAGLVGWRSLAKANLVISKLTDANKMTKIGSRVFI